MKRVVAVLAMVMAGLVPVAQAQPITGAGGTFPAPIYAKWGEAARAATGIELNYQAIGSGGGQNQTLNGTVDFGASDAPMDPEALATNNLLQFPTVIGAVVPVINLPGIAANQVKLTGELLAAIYLGKVTKWNDPQLARLNPDLTLPNLAIAPVYRADGSGTTFVFTSYLSAVSPDWKTRVGASTSVRWVAGHGARGNDGAAATVKLVRGSIGYVEHAYAARGQLTTTQLRNKAGAFVAPTPRSFTAAADAADWAHAPGLAVNLIDTAGAASWPIVSPTFVLVPKSPRNPTRVAEVLKFFDFAWRSGGESARDLDYIALPAAVQDAVRTAWRAELRAEDGTPLYQ
ncbi:Phosphate-binding protein PstS [Rhodovastum atsumiense]|uniref:Phosphate-binding protein PstS n=1 Tax=Rhodovastum atsumiense TaxID=504468 RepID=A0A5M6IU77_9PROT|nr:phosphate ABC transporter substrate-binding protein PstS [Rhodovastum atsumiense]KAA5611489.1 phosphate ABC transporter substrate-binding protein PstS [Rhodovastum atsumiense]CAH2601184.1 Phosphate-binding protein PstS [Rhodovastum atsumiense]